MKRPTPAHPSDLGRKVKVLRREGGRREDSAPASFFRPCQRCRQSKRNTKRAGIEGNVACFGREGRAPLLPAEVDIKRARDPDLGRCDRPRCSPSPSTQRSSASPISPTSLSSPITSSSASSESVPYRRTPPSSLFSLLPVLADSPYFSACMLLIWQCASVKLILV
jgi:hypothetical protein